MDNKKIPVKPFPNDALDDSILDKDILKEPQKEAKKKKDKDGSELIESRSGKKNESLGK